MLSGFSHICDVECSLITIQDDSSRREEMLPLLECRSVSLSLDGGTAYCAPIGVRIVQSNLVPAPIQPQHSIILSAKSQRRGGDELVFDKTKNIIFCSQA